jgi:hypothetical protein
MWFEVVGVKSHCHIPLTAWLSARLIFPDDGVPADNDAWPADSDDKHRGLARPSSVIKES